jgi:hypothetical protein
VREFIVIQGGSQQISQLLVERIGPAQVRLKTPIEKIVQTDDGQGLINEKIVS